MKDRALLVTPPSGRLPQGSGFRPVVSVCRGGAVQADASGGLGRTDFDRLPRLAERESRASSVKMIAAARFCANGPELPLSLSEWYGN
jgi:hypothetical protein